MFTIEANSYKFEAVKYKEWLVSNKANPSFSVASLQYALSACVATRKSLKVIKYLLEFALRGFLYNPIVSILI